MKMASLVADSLPSHFDLPNTPLVPHHPTNKQFQKVPLARLRLCILVAFDAKVIPYDISEPANFKNFT